MLWVKTVEWREASFSLLEQNSHAWPVVWTCATRRRCAVKTCLLCSNISPRYPPPSPLHPPFCLLLVVCDWWVLPAGGAVWGGVWRPGPEGPQQTPLHPAGAEGRPAREERAQGQSLPAAGGADLLQEVKNLVSSSLIDLTAAEWERSDSIKSKNFKIIQKHF